MQQAVEHATAPSFRWDSCGASIPVRGREAPGSRGTIGRPVVFKATSRDPFRPSLEYANPASSGGILVDMGIHDFDLARWFMGDVKTVSAIGGVLAYPEMASVGDIDNAIATLVFADGRLGVVDLTRNGVYGYDIAPSCWGPRARSASATCARRRC